jgi:ABC-type arginine transport system ATPase subunit
MEMKSANDRWSNPTSTALSIMNKHWPHNMTNTIKNMRQKKDNTGVVFDIYDNQYERF